MSVDAVTDDEVARLRRELERLRTENRRLSRLLDLRGQDTAPAPEQLAAMATPGPVMMGHAGVAGAGEARVLRQPVPGAVGLPARTFSR